MILAPRISDGQLPSHGWLWPFDVLLTLTATTNMAAKIDKPHMTSMMGSMSWPSDCKAH